MIDVLYIVLSGLFVLLVGYPIVVTFDKWKKTMDREEKDGEDDVQN